ncbi:MAG: nicotinamide mononucleotide transporter, partial [Nanoarchaeota archaeon]
KRFIHHVIEWVATALSIIGVLLVNLQNLNGLYIWIVANILWIFFAWKHKHWGLLVLACSYLIINIIGLINWKIN